MSDQPITDPDIIRAIQRLKELRWNAHAKQIDGKWAVSCQKWQFGFNVCEPTLKAAWLAALARAVGDAATLRRILVDNPAQLYGFEG